MYYCSLLKSLAKSFYLCLQLCCNGDRVRNFNPCHCCVVLSSSVLLVLLVATLILKLCVHSLLHASLLSPTWGRRKLYEQYLYFLNGNGHLNLMAGPWCPIMHQFSHKARINVKNGQLKVIKATLSLSRRLVHM